MRILLIGNFAPPYEEENLYNISLLRKLREDGHECTVINISEHPSGDSSFIDAHNNLLYLIRLMRHSPDKDVIHFLTKGYLRVGLLKLMFSIFAGTVFRAKKILTIHSEFFSVLGQMRSPFGGTQTLNTSFYLADRIIFSDKDTCRVAKMYERKNNFELIPSFIYVPDDVEEKETSGTEKLKGLSSLLFFTNVTHPSFLSDMFTELVTSPLIPETAGVAVVLSDRPSDTVRRGIEETGGPLTERIAFLEPEDLDSALKVCSKARIILKPMTCDGSMFFERFSICVKKTVRSGNFIYFPAGMVMVKEGEAAQLCARMVSTMMISSESDVPELSPEDSYKRILEIYEENK